MDPGMYVLRGTGRWEVKAELGSTRAGFQARMSGVGDRRWEVARGFSRSLGWCLDRVRNPSFYCVCVWW